MPRTMHVYVRYVHVYVCRVRGTCACVCVLCVGVHVWVIAYVYVVSKYFYTNRADCSTTCINVCEYGYVRGARDMYNRSTDFCSRDALPTPLVATLGCYISTSCGWCASSKLLVLRRIWMSHDTHERVMSPMNASHHI